MSLLFHFPGRAIERAVLGDLSAAAEARLRAHVRNCAACRSRYDQLASAKALLDGATVAGSRARARVIAAVDEARAGDGGARRPPRSRRWLPALFVLAPAAAIVLWVAKPTAPRPTVDEVATRGAPELPAVADAPTLVLYASRKGGPGGHGPVRLVGELPGSGEARVSLGDYLQLGVRQLRAAAHVRVVGVDARGVVHDYLFDTVATPTAGASVVGRGIELGRDHVAGKERIIARFSAAEIDDGAMKDAIAGRSGDGVVTGTLVIEP